MIESQHVFCLVCLFLVCISMTEVDGQGCMHIRADIQFLLDASGSVGLENYHKQKEFVANITQYFIIGQDNVQIGVTTFSSQVHNQFYMNQYHRRNALINAIKGMPYESGGTSTDTALRFVERNAFTKAHGDRDHVVNILIVMTDGHSAHPQDTATEASKLHGRGVMVIVIGIGNGVDRSELERAASNLSFVFTSSGFHDLSSLSSNILHAVCSVTETSAHSVTPHEVENTAASFYSGPCVDSTLIKCTDSRVCVDSSIKTYCPVTCGICIATTTAVPCHDVTYINCSDSHVCSDIQLKKYCPESCGLCGHHFEPVVPFGK